jgi:hypothetical protein
MMDKGEKDNSMITNTGRFLAVERGHANSLLSAPPGQLRDLAMSVDSIAGI